MKRQTLILLLCLTAFAIPAPNLTAAPSLPPAGEWDGVTPSAHLETPYEDQAQSNVPFGIVSYYMQPWRSYMDTWPASQYTGCPGANFNVDPKYADALGQILSESGIRNVRVEIGWGNLNWDDQLPDSTQKRLLPTFAMCRKYGIRPMILFNAHHGGPCPMRNIQVTLTADAAKGDTVLHLAAGTKVHEGFTGPMDAQYIAAYPLIIKVDPDGTAQLSAPLGENLKAGAIQLFELKYQPFQGDHLADGTPVPACQDTYDGWIKYVAAVASYVSQSLGTAGKSDAGFDMEVWNEQTFGSNFLDIDNYYAVKPQYKTYDNHGSVYVYKKNRPLLPNYRPDAKTDFEADNCYAILPMTIDYMYEHAQEYPGVKVVSGFANQWPWDNGTDLWPNQAGFSRHYYTGGWKDISDQSAPNIHDNGTESGVIDALGEFEGKKDNKDWHTVVPGTVFIPAFTMGFPEQTHSGFKTESLSRDVLPDSRYVYFQGHGRYTNNGDMHPAELWQTEVNFDRSQLFDDVIFKAGIKSDDPAALALDEHLAAKYMLRQYIFHNHKGLKRIYMFALNTDPYSLGMLPARFYTALDASNDVLTPEVRKTLPEGFAGLAWFSKGMDSGLPIDAPCPLKVADIVEYKPRLVWAGDGTPANPDRWNRDWFTFLPYQLSSTRYIIPYYVQTINQGYAWDKTRGLLDPKRWDMPAQDYDVTIANVRGRGATVAALDPITMKSVPVSVVSSTTTTLTVHLSTVDYPRFLTVSESKESPLIVNPKVELTPDNHVRVTWKTNIPSAVTITYGADWENRSAQQSTVKAGSTSFTVPALINGVVAVRIKATANGLTDVWPRWDEDSQGQIVAHPATQTGS